jgi:two-component system CheB/CheR fusion protein
MAKRGARNQRKHAALPAEGVGRHAPASPIICIGGSAGAISALKAFIGAIPAESGLGFVVVVHLDPSHKSRLAEIIARDSKLPVITASEGLIVEPNKIYVIPSNTSLTIEHRGLRLAPFKATEELRMPIDTFFMSLARDQNENAACVILSGTGSDGTLGLRAIKEHGGLTLAQSDAEYDGMMHSALSTGLVDFVLPAQDLPGRLADYFKRVAPEPAIAESAIPLTQICAVLRARTGHDFSGYKEKSLIRRVQRRLQVLKIADPAEFLERLRREPHEVELLLQDLLIGVTSFFRDPEVYAALEQHVIPRLFASESGRDSVRVWVPGCSTGEEAYSIAMLLRDHVPAGREALKVQVFATDIDEHAIKLARTGRYPATIARDVPERRLKRYFVREDGTFRVIAELREICLFSLHNVLRDAPFSKLDLISCRNLLIYLTPELQSRVIPLFHYALGEGGYLVLGTSENISRHARLFSTTDRTHRIFQRRNLSERSLPEFPLIAPAPSYQAVGKTMQSPAADGDVRSLAERELLDRHTPAYVIVNRDGELLYISGRVGKYLDFPVGAPTHSLFSMARRGLRLELRAALQKAISSQQLVSRGNISLEADGGRQVMEIVVQPLHQQQQGGQDTLYMVVFKDIGVAIPVTKASTKHRAEELESARVVQLEAELTNMRERLQVTTEELESSNEELKSSNEELSSMNQELQSANEELETSKEELQSINEELQTVNIELKSRVDDLSHANSDIANLLESTQIATVFLDSKLAINSFTPAAKDVFRLVASDVGRPLSHVRTRLRLDTVEEDAERVLRTLAAVEKQVVSDDGNSRYVMRILPYRTADNVIAGVVVTFLDVTRITAAEAKIDELSHDLRNRVENLTILLDLVPVGIFIAEDVQSPRLLQVNRYGARLLGDDGDRKGPSETSVPVRLLVCNGELPPEEQPWQRALRTGKPVPSFEGRLLRPDGSSVDIIASATPLFDEQGQARGAIAAMVDISARKKAEAEQEVLMQEMQHRVKNILATVSSLATRMLASHPSSEDFAKAFVARLRAMAAVHELLSAGKSQTVSLRTLAEIALEPYVNRARNNLALSGPDVALDAKSVPTLSMAFHELATNAAKYGALSSREGRIELSWGVERNAGVKRLSFAWRESNGPRIAAPPPSDGFGTSFVRRSIAYELNGTVEMSFEPDGFKAAIAFPLQESAATPGMAAT